MHGKRLEGRKKLARTPCYSSPSQLTIEGFETPFERKLSKHNRWVRLASLIPWDRIIPVYNRCFNTKEGRPPINGRVVIGALIIKHLESFSDRATLHHISENVYMQYFLGYSSFTDEAPFTAPLFVELRKRMSLELTGEISKIISTVEQSEEGVQKDKPTEDDKLSKETKVETVTEAQTPTAGIQEGEAPTPRGKLLMDATVAPQDITFPTDVKLLNSARCKCEELIDFLYKPSLHGLQKPRTYRQVARKMFLNIQKKKIRSFKEMRKAIGQQLRFVRRNLRHIDTLIASYDSLPLKPRQLKYLMVIKTVYDQQEKMHRERGHRIEDRIVSIHQPHVRPMVRGKDRQRVEFGSKLQVSVVDGFTFIDKLSWGAFNEGQCLKASVELYRDRKGYYPAEVLADKIYCNRENRQWLKERGIKLAAKPLGRPTAAAMDNHVRPSERNPIEGKFGQAKQAYGLNNIKARLKETSESWIACIALVLNLVRLAGRAPYYLIRSIAVFMEMISKAVWVWMVGGKNGQLFSKPYI